ncbi:MULTISPECIES: carboxy-S-adenosyl-L-methionine synthase CmoA [Rheinheimera]|jgi:tRNA (cmo5U34)-methyltransferase|uniref:carboxy-S-adenosyl-L-methionine synthase CmoA n=1 Tax=Rheinheimera TaxID=67575 RepID=UPI000E87691E|nr:MULTISPECIES: carboxy-S-adenosyl-L-methionine synthase CmoA [Rheinheimera]HBN88667.1 carboxy-S-adenosyl-L-methionine synthase CmoA [Rheinheimera sp.]|tara:strand:- start:8326 stop:9051 length:726 start_codon:yes stop_codon:yes gene_type:complete
MQKDDIFAEPLAQVPDFSFDAQVADVFPDMIQRSVPGYQTIIQTIGKLSSRFQQADSNYYDLGCSLGAATLAMRRNIDAVNSNIIAVDNSSAMVERCERHLQAFRSEVPVQVKLADIREQSIENAAIVVINFTLQFLPKADRSALLQRVYQGLKPGGLLILSEKFVSADSTANDLLVELHYDFKRANGYSELEISQKRSALENVMKPDTLAEHQQRLTAAGFNSQTLWFQCFNFCSMVAIK